MNLWTKLAEFAFIETEHLVLRPFSFMDSEDFYKIASNPENLTFIFPEQPVKTKIVNTNVITKIFLFLNISHHLNFALLFIITFLKVPIYFLSKFTLSQSEYVVVFSNLKAPLFPLYSILQTILFK